MRTLEREYLVAMFRRNPEDATAFGFPGADHAAVTNEMAPAVAAWHEAEDAFLARARAIDARALAGTPEGIARGVLVEALEGARGVRACRFELWPISSVGGWQEQYATLAEVQPVGTPELRGAARERVTAVARHVDVEIDNLREGIRLGYVATRENVERVVAELDRLLATPPARWPYVRPAARDGDPGFAVELAAAVERELVPAAERYRAFLRREYLEQARMTPSLLALPDGESCYRAAVRRHVTLEMDPQAIHETGLARVQELHLEMRRIAERSFGTSNVPELLRRLHEDPAFRLAAHAPPPDEIISRDGWPMPPGPGGGPEMGRYVRSSAFVEGWPLYSERVTAQRKSSSADLERLGALAREAFAAALLVVDPGVNVFGWRRERAIEYLVANVGLSPESAAWEVDRCAARPAEATAPMLGALEILRLRSEAERALGRRFDLRAYHEALLYSGAVTLPMLRERVVRFVRERGGGRRGR